MIQCTASARIPTSARGQNVVGTPPLASVQR